MPWRAHSVTVNLQLWSSEGIQANRKAPSPPLSLEHWVIAGKLTLSICLSEGATSIGCRTRGGVKHSLTTDICLRGASRHSATSVTWGRMLQSDCGISANDRTTHHSRVSPGEKSHWELKALPSYSWLHQGYWGFAPLKLEAYSSSVKIKLSDGVLLKCHRTPLQATWLVGTAAHCSSSQRQRP